MKLFQPHLPSLKCQAVGNTLARVSQHLDYSLVPREKMLIPGNKAPPELSLRNQGGPWLGVLPAGQGTVRITQGAFAKGPHAGS